MIFEWREVSEKQVMFCIGELGHVECSEIREELLSAIDTKRELTINLSEVTETGTIFVQLYLAAKKLATNKGISCEIVDASQAARIAFERVGVKVGA